jgi:hypothetical protein
MSYIYHVLSLPLCVQCSDGIACLDFVWTLLTNLIPIARSYLHAHNIIRGITGYGAGNGPYIAIHDGFTGLTQWADFLPGSDRIALDSHPYLAFSGQSTATPIVADDGSGEPGGVYVQQACGWGSDMKTRFGFRLIMGEPDINSFAWQSNCVWSDLLWRVQQWLQSLWLVPPRSR